MTSSAHCRTNALLIVAAGSGSRAGQSLPKQYVPVGGVPLLRHSVLRGLRHQGIGSVRVVIGTGQRELHDAALGDLDLPPPVIGGQTRQQSVFNGLRALADMEEPPDNVLIHDAARPFLPAAVIDRLLAALQQHEAVIPVLEVVDTIKRVDEHGIIVETPPRHRLRAAQTPQAFRFRPILQAHDAAARLPVEFSDDAAVAEHAGLRVATVAGDAILRKVTHPQDFRWAENMARTLAAEGKGDDAGV